MHHKGYHLLEGVKCYSIYPSEKQTPHPDPQIEVLKLGHPIPICESASPVSSYRWHSFSDEEFKAYQTRLEEAVYKQMDEAEKIEGTHFSLAISHHTFLNPLVMRNVIQRRIKEGKPSTALACFAHGTGLRMYMHELDDNLPDEFPLRFLPMIKDAKLFDPNNNKTAVQMCIVVSQQQVDTLLKVFPTFPRERIVISPLGINQAVFHPIDGCTIENTLPEFPSVHYEGSPRSPVRIDGSKYDHVVVMVCRFAESKRIPSLLYAAKIYESKLNRIATIIVGTGPLPMQKQLQDLAYDELNLQHTYFLGPQPQPVLAKLFTISSVGAFPFQDEAFGMVFVECMACGTPVIGSDSGGPKDFVDDSVGVLLPETDDIHALGANLNEAIQKAIKENWKKTHSKACLDLVESRFSVKKQVSELVETAKKQLKL